MIETFMMDTNTVSHIVRRRSVAARTNLVSLGSSQIACISSITQGEILYGLAKSPSAHVLRAAIMDFLSRILILPWGSREAESYGTLRAKLEAAGKSLDSLDMLIAAHAIAADATLVTSDKAFRFAQNPRGTINWATDI